MAQVGFLEFFPILSTLSKLNRICSDFLQRTGGGTVSVINLDSKAGEAKLLNAVWQG